MAKKTKVKPHKRTLPSGKMVPVREHLRTVSSVKRSNLTREQHAKNVENILIGLQDGFNLDKMIIVKLGSKANPESIEIDELEDVMDMEMYWSPVYNEWIDSRIEEMVKLVDVLSQDYIIISEKDFMNNPEYVDRFKVYLLDNDIIMYNEKNNEFAFYDTGWNGRIIYYEPVNDKNLSEMLYEIAGSYITKDVFVPDYSKSMLSNNDIDVIKSNIKRELWLKDLEKRI